MIGRVVHMKDDRLFETIIQREEIFRGRYLNLESLKIRLPDKRIGLREIVRVRDAVAVLPVDERENVYLVRQSRPAIGEVLTEIPAGLIDDGGETPAEAAIRECEEEIGLRPEKLTELITYAHAEGYSTGMISLFVGTDLRATGPQRLDETEFLEIVSMPFEELLTKVRKNEIRDSKTILATLLWLHLRYNPQWLDF